MGIDYRSLGVGWNHPATRMAYRKASHRSTRCRQSLQRQEESRKRITELVEAQDMKKQLLQLFLREIGVDDAAVASSARFDAIGSALEAELLLPLRALNECGPLHRTMTGAPLPAEVRWAVVALVIQLLRSV
eukprot:Skav220211  [mRNA]  locus=scaffold1600:20722:22560:- [translate_table: standard]